jgi:hypothetical protein
VDLKSVMEWLVTNKYVSIHKGKPKFTTTYYKESTGIEKGLTSQGTVRENLPMIGTGVSIAPFNHGGIALYTAIEWCHYYTEFIKACKIPSKALGTKGESYALNKYSEDGMKAFRQAMKDGYRLDVLIIAVSLYYKSSIALKKAVGNYMSSGEWKTDYQTLLEKAESGNLDTHIKNEIKKENGGSYQWG